MWQTRCHELSSSRAAIRWIFLGVFSGALVCTLASCQATVAVAGDYSVDLDFDEVGNQDFQDFVRLRFAHPALPLIVPPERTPKPVADAIRTASSLVWADPSASANRLRVAVEDLLTAHRIPKTAAKKGGGRRPLTTHDRIDLFRAKQPDVADALEAVKWIGNSGSHESSLTTEDILDGAEILDLALRSLYDRSDAMLLRKVAVINKKKGVPRKKAGSQSR